MVPTEAKICSMAKIVNDSGNQVSHRCVDGVPLNRCARKSVTHFKQSQGLSYKNLPLLVYLEREHYIRNKHILCSNLLWAIKC